MHFSPAVIAALVAYYVFSSAAGAMLPPEEGQERTRYGYWFRFCQQLAANGHRLAEQKLPGIAAGLAAKEDVHVAIDEHTEFNTHNGSD